MDADVLLLRLDHPDSLFSHLEDDAEDVHHVGLPDSLQMQRGIIKESTELQDIPQRKKCFKNSITTKKTLKYSFTAHTEQNRSISHIFL